jgi:hypothetical protein
VQAQRHTLPRIATARIEHEDMGMMLNFEVVE